MTATDTPTCDHCGDPADDDRAQPCAHFVTTCAEHADECRECHEDAITSRWAELDADEAREGRAG